VGLYAKNILKTLGQVHGSLYAVIPQRQLTPSNCYCRTLSTWCFLLFHVSTIERPRRS